MPILQNSRNLLTVVVRVVSPVTGELTQPEFVDLRKRVETTASDDSFVTVKGSMTWSNLGLAKLGDARHWWIGADLSNVVDPFNDIIPGTQLRFPSQGRFLFRILAPDQTST